MGRLPRTDAGNPLRAYLKEQRRVQRQQGSASAFTRSGMNVTGPGELASDDFDGDIANRDAGTAGWGASGGTLAAGDLLLRPRSIGDESLSSIVTPDLIYVYADSFTVSKPGATVLSNNLTVPEGYTSVIITATGKVHAYNQTPDLDYLYSQLFIGGYSGANIPEACSGNNGSITSIAPLTVYLGDLVAGDTIDVHYRASTSNADWVATSGNTAELSGSILWFR